MKAVNKHHKHSLHMWQSTGDTYVAFGHVHSPKRGGVKLGRTQRETSIHFRGMQPH